MADCSGQDACTVNRQDEIEVKVKSDDDDDCECWDPCGVALPKKLEKEEIIDPARDVSVYDTDTHLITHGFCCWKKLVHQDHYKQTHIDRVGNKIRGFHQDLRNKIENKRLALKQYHENRKFQQSEAVKELEIDIQEEQEKLKHKETIWEIIKRYLDFMGTAICLLLLLVGAGLRFNTIDPLIDDFSTYRYHVTVTEIKTNITRSRYQLMRPLRELGDEGFANYYMAFGGPGFLVGVTLIVLIWWLAKHKFPVWIEREWHKIEHKISQQLFGHFEIAFLKMEVEMTTASVKIDEFLEMILGREFEDQFQKLISAEISAIGSMILWAEHEIVYLVETCIMPPLRRLAKEILWEMKELMPHNSIDYEALRQKKMQVMNGKFEDLKQDLIEHVYHWVREKTGKIVFALNIIAGCCGCLVLMLVRHNLTFYWIPEDQDENIEI